MQTDAPGTAINAASHQALRPSPRAHAPSLLNASTLEWETHSELDYILARHVSHDLINMQCKLQLVDTIERMLASGQIAERPPGFGPEEVRQLIRATLSQVAAASHDAGLLTQATAKAAYRHVCRKSLGDLLNAILGDRGQVDSAVLERLLPPSIAELMVVELGDMLSAALGACAFQWAGGSGMPVAVPVIALDAALGMVRLTFPALQRDPVASFAERVALLPTQVDHLAIANSLGTTTTELALWQAGFILKIHGGSLTAEAPGNEARLIASIPLA